MAYNIAVVSTDGKYVDGHFGKADYFRIVHVKDDGSYSTDEIRKALGADAQLPSDFSCGTGTPSFAGGCGGGAGEGGGRCGGGQTNSRIAGKIKTISDCRCVLCAKFGSGSEKQLQRKAISIFQIELPLSEALDKIIKYYSKIDNHISLRRKG